MKVKVKLNFHFNLTKKRVQTLLWALLGVILLPSIALSFYSVWNAKKVYANQFIGSENISFKSKEDLKIFVEKKSENYPNQEISLENKTDEKGKTYLLKPSEIGLRYDVEATVNQIWAFGRRGSVFISLWEQLQSIFLGFDHNAAYTYDENLLRTKLASIAKEIDLPEKDFSFSYKDGSFALNTDRSNGRRVDQEALKQMLDRQFSHFQMEKITFTAKPFILIIKDEKARKRLGEANRILDGGDLRLVYNNQEFKIDRDMIGGMIQSKQKEDDLEIVFRDDRLNKFIDSIAEAVNVEPRNAKLRISDGRATVFQTSQLGQTVERDQVRASIEQALLERITVSQSAANSQKIVLIVTEKKPEIAENEVNSLGISELIGSATTNFKGSPVNRVHNIQTGAAALNGMLLKPGEVFSTIGQLGEIDGSSGYLPELVIKEDRTTPEFGGGLCQVSTTLFRAAMNSGMKITDRSNHKYRVGYYEPPVGMDATIYDPAPDFKFLNDYASHVLIQSKVEGTKITFEFYGTKDNRKVQIGDPEVYDYVEPGPRINVETDTLAPGEEKQIEKAHQGASAKFHYRVEKDGQVLQETDFRSKYVPWPEKWLVGKQQPLPPISESQPGTVAE